MNDKLLTLLMGQHWHEVKQLADVQRIMAIPAICTCGAIFEANEPIKRHIRGSNPDFSDPRHLYEFFTWLIKERPQMWEEFHKFAEEQYNRGILFFHKFDAWLFFSDPARPRDLMAEWLRLDSTVERFGWVECSTCESKGGTSVLGFTVVCPKCNGTGRVLAPWARYAKEGKDA